MHSVLTSSPLPIGTNHPTITTPQLGLSVLERFSSEYTPPTAEEGFDRIKTISPHPTPSYTREEIQAILDSIRDSPVLSSRTISSPLQFFRTADHRRDNFGGGRFRSASPPSNASQRGNMSSRGYSNWHSPSRYPFNYQSQQSWQASSNWRRNAPRSSRDCGDALRSGRPGGSFLDHPNNSLPLVQSPGRSSVSNSFAPCDNSTEQKGPETVQRA